MRKDSTSDAVMGDSRVSFTRRAGSRRTGAARRLALRPPPSARRLARARRAIRREAVAELAQLVRVVGAGSRPRERARAFRYWRRTCGARAACCSAIVLELDQLAVEQRQAGVVPTRPRRRPPRRPLDLTARADRDAAARRRAEKHEQEDAKQEDGHLGERWALQITRTVLIPATTLRSNSRNLPPTPPAVWDSNRSSPAWLSIPLMSEMTDDDPDAEVPDSEKTPFTIVTGTSARGRRRSSTTSSPSRSRSGFVLSRTSSARSTSTRS